ncbi:MAG: HAMP domain-containing sensor histidine kinase, partial [Thermotaleaceae bacterium]
IGTLLALFLAKFFVKPIVKIIEAAESISKGDFSVKVIHQSNDEIGILGETINDMAVQLDKIERLRKEFIANVSHELKTPITLIKAYAEVVKDMDLGEQDEQQHLQVIIEESDRLNDMVEDILYLSKMESGFSDLQYGEVSLDEVIDCIIEKLSYFASQKNIQIVMEIDAIRPIVYGDENKLYQVFYNIINNAIHHSYENSKIFVKVFDMVEGLRIEIIDEGSGIPEEDLPHIWDRFYKVDKSRKRDESGTGLGMAIVKNILEAHHFKYGITSNIDQGTTVWIEI